MIPKPPECKHPTGGCALLDIWPQICCPQQGLCYSRHMAPDLLSPAGAVLFQTYGPRFAVPCRGCAIPDIWPQFCCPLQGLCYSRHMAPDLLSPEGLSAMRAKRQSHDLCVYDPDILLAHKSIL
ncbi:hypothetical protein DPMN_161446 [Dreissena polymorpha]|uniref:Uncharacterized protein n=1 Tax=Dreissena polymorpha TaxID=45954 RepID=A0A9D4EQF6_DREPO|nr:hypothetical protein DPMN_161446 [Dreissena polymorpha]